MKQTCTLEEIAILLNELYDGLSGHGISLAEMNAVWARGASPLYGELTPAGVDRLGGAITPPLGLDDVFYDLGSGIGKICVQLCLGSSVGRVVGIELSASRHRQARQVHDNLRRMDLPLFETSRLEFVQDDFLGCTMADATVIYLCSLSYSETLMKALARKINIECSRLRLVIAATRFAELEWKTPPRRILLASTWSDSVPFFYYTREIAGPP
ncbi:MAG: hypothetical protein JXQ27_12775 [Acidobacteria bacterium]|nr:hypothetical protein [Acidobacteriota bacterium]